MKKWNSTAIGALTLMAGLTWSGALVAQAVTLTSSDGTVNMTGNFVDFQDNAYIISTALGEMRVSASRVNCTGAACPDLTSTEADIVIGGSDTVGVGLMPLLLEGYAGFIDASADIVNTGNGSDIVADLIGDQGFGDDIATVLVSSTSSNDAFARLLDQQIEVAMSARRILPTEARALRDAGAGNMVDPSQEHIIAVDSLVMVTHPDNPIESLTTAQVREIYSGQITNWSQVGGPDLPITVISRIDGSATRTVFEDRVFGEQAVAITGNAIVAQNETEASQIVNESVGAVAYVGYAFQRGANPLTLINECGIPMVPDAFSARTEEYALQRRLFLYTREDTASTPTRDLVAYATSAEADNVIGKAGFIGFAVDRKEQALDGVRGRSLLNPEVDAYEASFMRQMLGQMVDYDRLSTTFRFRTGSSELDERGQIDKERLVAYLKTQPQGTEVLMVGFTDTVGEFDGNLGLSRQRAAQVASDLIATSGDQLGNISISSLGFGEIAPSGCNTNEEGRRINRRVEVWIKSPA